MNWAQQQRMEFITGLLTLQGHVNRKDLETRFLIGVAQAARDIRRYKELHPQAMVYNRIMKRYERNTAEAHNMTLDTNRLLTAQPAAVGRTPEDDEKECKLTEAQAINRLCCLVGAVRNKLGGSADCFCQNISRDPTSYRNDGTAIEFIEAATRAALKDYKDKSSGHASRRSPTRKVLRLRGVMAKVGLGRDSVYKLIRERAFPRPIKLTRTASGWFEDEVDAYLAKLAAARDEK